MKTPPGFEHLQPVLAAFSQDHPDFERNVFLAMRFGRGTKHAELHEAIKAGLGNYGLNVLRADDGVYPHDHDLWSNTCVYMLGCGLAVCVFDEIECLEFSPNIAIELGFMRALNRRILLLKDRRVLKLASDLAGKVYRDFDVDNITESVQRQIGDWAERDLGLPRVGAAWPSGMRFCKPGTAFSGGIQCLPYLIEVIQKSAEKHELLVSVADADATLLLLRRLFDEVKSRQAEPRISAVVLKHLSPAFIEEATEKRHLASEFKVRLMRHLAEIESYLELFNVGVRRLTWDRIPSFHGFVFDSHAFMGPWGRNTEDQLHTRTPMTYYTKDRYPRVLEESVREFFSA